MQTNMNDPETFSVYAFGYLQAHGEEGTRLEIERWAETAYPEDFEYVMEYDAFADN